MCHILNCNFWPKPTSNVEPYVVQLNPFKNVFDCYSGMEVFTVFTADGVTESRAFSSNLLQKWTELSAILQIWAEIYKI